MSLDVSTGNADDVSSARGPYRAPGFELREEVARGEVRTRGKWSFRASLGCGIAAMAFDQAIMVRASLVIGAAIVLVTVVMDELR